MRKLLLVSITTLLLGITSLSKAQCYGTVNLDQNVSANGASSFDITTTFSNELILISTDGWPGPFTGSVTVDAIPATLVNSATIGNSGESAVWCYAAAAAGTHAIVVTETGYSSSFDFDLNFAASYYATNTCIPLSISNVSSVATTINCNTGGSITDNITTTAPNSMIYCNAECNDVTSNSYSFTYTGATFLADYHAGAGIEASDANTSATTAGAYSITATSASPNITSSCEGGFTIIMVAIQPPACGVSVSITSSTNPTCSNSNGSITASGSGGTLPYTYSWSPSGGTNATATGLSAGTYTVTLTDNNGCTATASATLTATSTLAATASVTNEVKCSGNSTGSVNAVATGGTTPYTYLWNPGGATTASVSNLSAGTYTVTVDDNGGCSVTASVTITQPTALSISIASQTNVLCNGGATGSATANAATGGTAPYTYNWAPSGGSNLTASNLSAGTYTITATDNNGCSATASVTITQPANGLGITIASHTNVLCNGGATGSATANAATGGTSPYTYNWAPSGGTNLTASNLSAGTYTITATDNNGCTATASVTITQPANGLGITIASQTNVLCNGGATGSATANAATGGTSPYTYNWTPSGGTNLTASNLSAGTYTITVNDNNGCSATASVTITQPANGLGITIASQTNVLCNGDANGSAAANAATGGTAPYTYNWTPSGGTNLTASNLSAGTYTITVNDNNGCSATASVTITQPANGLGITIASQTNVLCNGGATGSATANAATGGTAPYTYNWTPSGGTNLTASNLSAGSYTITATDNNGCSATASVTITQPANGLGITIASQTNVLCNGGATGSATANAATGGTAPYTYNWTPSGGTNLTASNLSAGVYTITVTDNNGCAATASATITQPASPVAISIASQTNILCNTLGSATANAATGGTGPYTYNWTPSGGTNLTAPNLSAGTYTITATDNNGCAATASVTITQAGATLSITIASKTTLVCEGIGTIAAHAATGGTPPYLYNWTPSGGTNLTTITTLPPGSYTVTATDSNGCTATASETISTPPHLNSTASSTSITGCYGASTGSATVVPTGGTTPYTYSWIPSGETTANISNLTAGSYSVTVTDSNGCVTRDTVTITEPAGMVITTDSINSVTIGGACNGIADVTVVSGGVAPYTYLWSPGGETTDTIKGQCIGDYCCTISDANGCSITACVVVLNVTSIENINNGGSSVNIYPDPSNGLFTITGVEKGMNIEMYDYTGREITNMTAGDSTLQLDITNKPNGIYFIRILTKDGVLVDAKKVVKTN